MDIDALQDQVTVGGAQGCGISRRPEAPTDHRDIDVSDWLLDRVDLMFGFVVPYSVAHDDQRTVASDNNELETITSKVKRVFNQQYLTANAFYKAKHRNHKGRAANLRVTCKKARFGGVEIRFAMDLSPIRHLRQMFYPAETEVDFSGNDNFIPFSDDYRSFQRNQLDWVRSQFNQLQNQVRTQFHNCSLSWIKCTHLEIIYDILGDEDNQVFDEIVKRLQSSLSDCSQSTDGQFHLVKGKAKDAKLGVYKKGNRRCRLQLTLESDAKLLKESGQSLKPFFNFNDLVESVVKFYEPYLKEALSFAITGASAPPVPDLALAEILGKIVPPKAGIELAKQHARTGQLIFKGELGSSRTKLKKLGAIRLVGKGIYKLCSTGKLNAIVEAQTKENLRAEQSLTVPDATMPRRPALESLLNRVSELSWSDRMTAFAWLLLPGLRSNSNHFAPAHSSQGDLTMDASSSDSNDNSGYH